MFQCSTQLEEQCRTVESEECRTEMEEVCETVTDMTCLAPSEVCTSLTSPDCSTVWRQQCSPSSPSPSIVQPRQTFQGSIQDVKNVPKVVSVTSFRDPTKSSSIINRWFLHVKQKLNCLLFSVQDNKPPSSKEPPRLSLLDRLRRN